METKYLTCAETAKIVRAALKQSFPGVKFSVRSRSSIDVTWTDGPTQEQVQKITDRLEGATFDAMTDYKGGRVHNFNGELVHFGADFICLDREKSENLYNMAVEKIYKEYAGNLAGIAKPGFDEYKTGKLYGIAMFDNSPSNMHNLQEYISKAMARTSLSATNKTTVLNGLSVERTY